MARIFTTVVDGQSSIWHLGTLHQDLIVKSLGCRDHLTPRSSTLVFGRIFTPDVLKTGQAVNDYDDSVPGRKVSIKSYMGS